jgi:hypothetical protein
MNIIDTRLNPSAYPGLPYPYMPERAPKHVQKPEKLQSKIIAAGSCGIFMIGLLRLFPNQIFRGIAKVLEQMRQRGVRLSFVPQSDYFRNLVKDRKKLDKKLVALLGAALLLQSPIHYQTSFNTKQPSSLLKEGMSTVYQVGSFFTSSVVFRTLFSLVSGLFAYTGKQNDIGNTRNMQTRREWDLHRLMPNQFKLDAEHLRKIRKEYGSFVKYIWGDLKTTLSVKPWRELFRTYKQKSTWLEPNSYFTDLAAQFGLVANLANLWSLKPPKPLEGLLKGVPFPFMILRNLASTKTEMIRAWQDKTDLDGILLLGSMPFTMVGTLFFISKKYFYLNSIALLAGPFQDKGLNLNSQYRREAINYIQRLYNEAQRKPALNAAQILQYYESSSEAKKHLKKRVGTIGMNFIFDSLRMAEMKNQAQGLPLSQVLYPITLSYEKTK